MAGYIPRRFTRPQAVTQYLTSNRAHCRLTTLIEANALTITTTDLVLSNDNKCGYGSLAAYISGPATQTTWLNPKVGGHLVSLLLLLLLLVNYCYGNRYSAVFLRFRN